MNNNTGFEQIWTRLTRVVAFCVGLAMMVYETLADSQDRPWLYAAAVGMMGLPVARAAENVLSKIGTTGVPHTDPGKEEIQPHKSSQAGSYGGSERSQ